MEIGTDTTARIAADILIAALEAKAIAPGGPDVTPQRGAHVPAGHK